ncbi:MAG: 23S rRNA (uracil(1939)-C(5))-methyltransferase RlmD [Candidatus Marinimicrobia bacterium]|nr:23S rRNA (uracil(1939)-C(5))-methyltransferase RlmD [Candidatus Neomarinimicrobiota bacterium]MDD5709456.1 23S rRNA (uracil(1939)-C(5))-methyltransferase RlmD [Candidatus Neomarinimicrobiota bacterium]
MIDIRKNDELELKIESIAFGGKGIARKDNFVIFVRDALPGQIVKALIIKKRSGFAEAIITDVIQHSPDEIPAPCPYFGDCGGCRFQNLAYPAQLAMKTAQVRETYAHLAGMPDIPILPALPAPEIYGYRNKMDFSTGVSRWIQKENDRGGDRDFAIGLHAPGRFDKILDIDACLLQDEERNAIFHEIREIVREENLPLNNPREQSGFLRNIVIRKGEHSGEIMVNIVTRYENKDLLDAWIAPLTIKFPAICSVVNNITNSMGDQSVGEKEVLLFGKPVIHDCLGGKNYEIAANAFFQTNTRAAEQLYEVVLDFASPRETDVVWDFYCGTGSIALFIAEKVKKVYGFELVEDAVRNAKRNAVQNGVENCAFFTADLDRFLQQNPELIAGLEKPDLVIVDPPRSGLNPKFLQQLIGLRPPRIVYVSCNPATQARDIVLLSEAGYRTEKIQPVDMFPHTAHIESVALLLGGE